MKVLMFGWEFPPHISGGLGTACYGLTKSLASLSDIDLTFVVPKAFGDEDSHKMKLVGASDVELSPVLIKRQRGLEKQKKIEFNLSAGAYTSPEQFREILIQQKTAHEHLNPDFNQGKFDFSGKYGNTLFREISRYGIVAAELAGREKYDIIHAHDWLTYPAGIEAKKSSGKPLIVHVHATEFDRSGEIYNPKVFEIEQEGMQIADKVITVSDFTRRIVIEKYNIQPSKVVTIHNGVESFNENSPGNTRKNEKDDKLVSFLGRITKQKGPEYFIEAAYKVLQRMKNVRFVMAGSGDLLEGMIKIVAGLKIADRFHFTGFLQADEVTRLFAISDLYVMPSVSEPFGITPLEAIQCNVPVIISRQSGVSEVIKNAIKLDFWDTDSLADAIYGVLNYKSLSVYLKTRGKLEIDHLNWMGAAKKVKNIYIEVA